MFDSIYQEFAEHIHRLVCKQQPRFSTNNDSCSTQVLRDRIASSFVYLDRDQPIVNYDSLIDAIYSIVYMPLMRNKDKIYPDYNKRENSYHTLFSMILIRNPVNNDMYIKSC
jgi:hypothetical protein